MSIGKPVNMEEIIIKYLSQTATGEEKIILLQWLEEKQENKRHFSEMYDLWLSSHAVLTDDNEMETALDHLQERIKPLQKDKTRRSFHYPYPLRIAAAILLLLFAGYLGYRVGDQNEQQIITMNRLLTGPDGKGEYVLPDGSTVWLNANSVLIYPEIFKGSNRTVKLEGEALFNIKQDKRHPFIVEADGLDIEVLGTRFLARNYTRKNIVETVLVNGSIKIEGNYFPESRILHPGEMLTYNKLTRETNIAHVDTEDYTNWIYDKLVFDRTNLSKVIVNLEKWFGVDIVATPELLRNTHMSFTVRRESLEEVLKYMSLTAPVEHKWVDDVLYLSRKK